jgi:N-acetylglucosaminyldiphosphoundecaprenol N-acetyl-beta-D-mannosaminyltransferase
MVVFSPIYDSQSIMSHAPTTATLSSIPANFAIGPGLSSPNSSLKLESPESSVKPLPLLRKSKIWGSDFSHLNMAQALDYIDHIIQRGVPEYLITANLNYLMLCEKSPRLADFTRKAAVVLCDGMPVLWRSWFNPNKLPERVAGADLIFSLAERCAKQGHRLFLMGGAEGVAQSAAQKLCQMYPKLQIVGAECPPFRQLNAAEHKSLCNRIKNSQADVLLVAFGQPKGEFWIEDNYRALGVPVSIQLGASFDFIVGNARRAPMILQRFGLEWLYRMLHDPKRLVPRYANNALFLLKSIRRDLLEATS